MDHQAGSDVAIRHHDLPGLNERPDLCLDVVVAISRIQAGQRVPADGLSQVGGQFADRPIGGLSRDRDVLALCHKHCAKWRMIVVLPAPLGPSMLTNRPTLRSEESRLLIVATYCRMAAQLLQR